MSLPITDKLNSASQQTSLRPQLVFQIDGVEDIFGIQTITSFVRIGDPDLLIGNDWLIGGIENVDDQKQYLSLNGTTTSIKQTLELDKARSSSVSTFQVQLIDFNNEVSNMISPGQVVDDILGRKCKVYLGIADNTSFPEDYVTIFRGVVDEIISGPGYVDFNLTHTDQKKRQSIFVKADTALDGAINNVTTSITLSDTVDLLQQVNGPSGSPESAITNYVLIDDEVIKYTTYTGNVLNGVVRGQLGTTAAAHDDEASVTSFYRLNDTAINLALKLMLSGKNDYFVTDAVITNFNNTDDAMPPNTMFFRGYDLEDLYNVQVGDFITTTGASNGANNVTLKEITGVEVRLDGTVLTIDGVTFVEELDTAATLSIRSQYDSLGVGLAMDPDEVDINEHLIIDSRYLSDFEYDFYIKDTIDDAKEFIEKEIYLPAAAYSLPRKAQSSVGIFSPPIPGGSIVTIDKTNILNPSKLKLRRSISKDYINTIIYRYEEQVLEEKFTRGLVTQNADSITRIHAGVKSFTVTSKGLRENLNGFVLAQRSTDRKLDIYKYAAEVADGIEVHFGDGFKIEIGDIIIFDPTDLSVTDLATGDRTKGADLYFVKNKTINFKTGKVVIDIMDTGFEIDTRFGLISPSSYVSSGISTTKFEITSSFASVYGANEGQKWSDHIGEIIKVRNSDFSISDTATIVSVVGNIVTVSPALAFTPAADYIMELANYDDASDTIKLTYAFMSDTAFGDGGEQYQMI